MSLLLLQIIKMCGINLIRSRAVLKNLWPCANFLFCALFIVNIFDHFAPLKRALIRSYHPLKYLLQYIIYAEDRNYQFKLLFNWFLDMVSEPV